VPGPYINRDICIAAIVLGFVFTVAIFTVAMTTVPQQPHNQHKQPSKAPLLPKQEADGKKAFELMDTWEWFWITLSVFLIFVIFLLPSLRTDSREPFRTAATWGCRSAGCAGVLGVVISQYCPIIGILNYVSPPWSAYQLTLLPTHAIGFGIIALIIGGVVGGLYATSQKNQDHASGGFGNDRMPPDGGLS
jgi:hypothetical protein